MRITKLEKQVLTALYHSSAGNGHDFGLVQECRKAVAESNQLAGVMASLVKKGLIVVHGDVTTDSGTWTQTTWNVPVEQIEALINPTTNRAEATPGNKESNMTTATATEKKTTTTKPAAKKATTKPAAKKATTKPAAKKQPAKKVATKKAAAPKATKKVAAKKAAPKTVKPAAKKADGKVSRKDTIVALISRPTGATLAEIMEATGWQAHSVRGTISILSKGLTITSDKSSSGERVYTAEPKVA